MKIGQNAIEWLASGERGVSSDTIFSHLTGIKAMRGNRKDHPYDPDDFRRCALLLDEVPELVPEFHRMAEVSPAWAELVKHWDEICRSMDEEFPGWLSRNPPRRDHSRKRPFPSYELIQRCIGRLQ